MSEQLPAVLPSGALAPAVVLPSQLSGRVSWYFCAANPVAITATWRSAVVITEMSSTSVTVVRTRKCA